jgi:hypothetical protein
MAETKSIAITLPDAVWGGAMALAEKRKLSLDALVQDAILKYERAGTWQELRTYGAQQSELTGYREEDVVGLCRETRAEIAAEDSSGAKAPQCP